MSGYFWAVQARGRWAITKTASQFDKFVVVQRLEDCAVHAGQVRRCLRLHAPNESELRRFDKLEIRWDSTQRHFVAPWKPGSERLRKIRTTQTTFNNGRFVVGIDKPPWRIITLR